MAPVLKMCLAKLWSMYEEENMRRLKESVVNTKAYFMMRDKKLKVDNELRFPSWPCKTGSY